MLDLGEGQGPGHPAAVDTREDLAAALTRLRESAGLTVRDVAKKAGIPVGTVSGYFSGRHVPPTSALPQVHALLEVCGVRDPVDVDAWTEAIARVRRAPGRRPADAPVPYKGLAAFTAEDRAWFFGREELTGRIVELLQQPGLDLPVVVVGPSGSGKSSLLHAGVVPTLQEQGHHPLLMTPGAAPTHALSRWLRQQRPGDRLLVVVDQAEELFTEAGEDERVRFTSLLHQLAANAGSNVRVVLGLRSDFYSAAMRLPALVPALERQQVLVGPMSSAGLRAAIIEPATHAGVDVEDGLVDAALHDLSRHATGPGASYDAGALPLLSHALLTTWQRMSKGRLSLADYRDAGGIDGAVAATAEQAYAELNVAQQRQARHLLLALVHVVDGMALARQRVPRDRLPDVGPVLERFVDARLLLADDDTVQIAHEALLRAWPRLRGWVEEDREGLRVRQQLATSAALWAEHGRDPQLLHRGALLAAAQEWAAEPDRRGQLAVLEGEFLDTSIAATAAATATERRRSRRLRRLTASLTVLLVATSTLAVVSYREKAAADRHRDTAVSRQMADTANRLAATDVALARQLALAAYRVSPTREARSALLSTTSAPDVTRLPAADGVLQAVAFGARARRLVTAGADGARLWDVTGSPHLLRRLTGGDGVVYAAAFSPDGTHVATAGADKKVRLWRADGSGSPRVLQGPTNTVYALAFTPDGRQVLAGDADGGISVWPVAGGQPTRLSAGAAVHGLSFTPDGRLLAAGAGSGVRLWRFGSAPAPVGPPLDAGAEVTSVAFDPAGSRLAAGSRDHAVHLWNVEQPAAPKAARTLTGPTEWVNSVAFSPDGRTVLAGSSDAQVRRWDVATGDLIDTLTHPGPVTAVAVSPNGELVATADNDGRARLWQLPEPTVTAAGANLFGIVPLAGRHLFATAAKDDLHLWRLTGGGLAPAGRTVTAPKPYGPLSGTIAATPDGRLVAAGGADGAVHLFDVSTPDAVRVVHTLTGPEALIELVAISPDGRLLAAGSDDQTVWLWDISDPAAPRKLARLTGPTSYVQAVAFSPDGRTLAAGGADDNVWLWDVSQPAHPTRLAGPVHGPTGYIYSLAFSPDGRTLAAGSDDKAVWLWDLADRRRPRLVGPVRGPDSFVFTAVFSADGRTLAAASGDGVVWLWDVRDMSTPVPTARLAGATGPLFTLAYLPDGRLAAGGADHMVRVWQTSPAAAGREICADVGTPISRSEWKRYVPGVSYAPPC